MPIGVQKYGGETEYCEHCGAKLILLSEAKIGYEGHKGEPKYKFKLRCFNKRHWWDSHSSGTWIGIKSA